MTQQWEMAESFKAPNVSLRCRSCHLLCGRHRRARSSISIQAPAPEWVCRPCVYRQSRPSGAREAHLLAPCLLPLHHFFSPLIEFHQAVISPCWEGCGWVVDAGQPQQPLPGVLGSWLSHSCEPHILNGNQFLCGNGLYMCSVFQYSLVWSIY